MTLLGLCAAVILTWNSRSADPDLFARVAVGRLVVRDWSVPSIDPFAFTLKKPLWIDHEWLSGVIFYLAVNTCGDLGILLLRIALIALTVWLISAAMCARGRCLPFCLLWAIALCTYIWSSPLRAQVFTYAALAGLGWMMVHVRRTERVPKLYWIVAIFAAWTNLHGGVVAGLAIFVSFCLCQAYTKSCQRGEWLLVALAALVGAAITPYGVVQYWGYLLEAVTMSRPTIGEWAALNPFSGPGLIWLLWVIVLVLGMLVERKRIQLSEVAVIALSIIAGLKANRLSAIVVIIGATYASVYLAAGLEYLLSLVSRRANSIRRAGVAAVITLFCIFVCVNAASFFNPSSYRLSFEDYPLAALDWLKSNRSGGKLLNDFNVGSFALWRLYPSFLISLDGRYETVYLDQTLNQVTCALNPECPQWQSEISKIAPDFVLIASSSLANWEGRIDWRVAYKDLNFAILESPQNALLAAPSRNISDVAGMWQANF